MQHATIISRGLRLHADVYPAASNAPAVIFLPGTAKYAGLYGAFLERLQEANFNVLALDPQGHGRSEGVRGDFSMEELIQNARDALSFAERELSSTVALVGTSQGALVALYTLTIAERVASAVCHNAALLDEPESARVNVSNFSRRVRPFAPLAALLAAQRQVPIRRYLPLDRVYDDLELGQAIEGDPLVVPGYTLRSFASLSHARPPRPVELISTPTMFLASENDRLFPVDYVRSIFDRLTCEKKFALLPDTGHMLFVEYAEQSAPLVADWLERTLRRDT
jgi:pimeloyl-ACP methyl ester carboxylesterase